MKHYVITEMHTALLIFVFYNYIEINRGIHVVADGIREHVSKININILWAIY